MPICNDRHDQPDRHRRPAVRTCTRCKGVGKMCWQCNLTPVCCVCREGHTLAPCESCDGQGTGGIDARPTC